MLTKVSTGLSAAVVIIAALCAGGCSSDKMHDDGMMKEDKMMKDDGMMKEDKMMKDDKSMEDDKMIKDSM